LEQNSAKIRRPFLFIGKILPSCTAAIEIAHAKNRKNLGLGCCQAKLARVMLKVQRLGSGWHRGKRSG
jgi:hypothetical protein